MKFFKHMSTMRNDPKIKRLISRYGLKGYGLYCIILESIVDRIEQDSPIPDLEENSEDIASFYNENTSEVNEITSFMVNNGLFEVDEITARITCMKIYRYLELSQTRSTYIKNIIKSYKKGCLNLSETVSDKSGDIDIEEEIEVEKELDSSRFKKPTIQQIKEYCDERNNGINPESFFHYYESKGWMVGRNKMKSWKSAIATWENRNKQPSKEFEGRTML